MAKDTESNIEFNTFNTRGLGDVVKRRVVFTWLQEHHKGITFLQETHSTKNYEKSWKEQWGGEILFSHGSSNARGVAILLPPNLQYDIKNIRSDQDGRLVLVDIELEGRSLTLCNIYAPTKDKPQLQKQFLINLREILVEYVDKDILIGGDFNVCINPELDKKGGTVEAQSDYSKDVVSLMEELELTDIWRQRHPTHKRFTRREKTVRGFVQSRLDFWLVSRNLEYSVKNTEIQPGRRSDHSIVIVQLSRVSEGKRGKGFWKLNTSLLKDKLYLEKIRGCIQNSKANYAGTTNDKRLLWDVIKCDIRSETIRFAINKSKADRQMEHELTQKLKELEISIASDPSDDTVAEYNVVKLELDRLLLSKARGAMLRSKAKWVEESEKNTSYFLKLERRNQKIKSITKLCTSTEEITDESEILLEEQRFYEQLYSNHDNKDSLEKQTCEKKFLENMDIPKLSKSQSDECDDNLTLHECSTALRDLPNGKSPGSDGLPAEFYKVFWTDVKELVLNSYMYSFEVGEMSIDQRRGVITLIPKQGKDLRYLSNWRPISLLNADYKILAKALANRLQGVISNIINPDQTGYIKKRYIGDNIRTISDIIDYCNNTGKLGIVALLDFQKAFDSISWSFLEKTLQAFSFGNTFKKWCQTLYCNSVSCVTNNGNSTAFFPLGRGVRQGCPLSPLLFILAVEILACKLRSDQNVRGITINEEIFKISQLADDTTLFLNDVPSLKAAMLTLEDFSKISGLLLNRSKTQVLCINPDTDLPELGIKWLDGPFKALGIWFSNDSEAMLRKNFSNCLEIIKCQLNIWRQRGLSLKGKITIITTLIVSKLVYISSMLYVPPWFIKSLDKLLINFVWDGKPAKIKKSTLIGDIADGGMKMPHIDSKIKALKLSWLKRLVDDGTCGRWKTLSWKMLGNYSTNDLTYKMQPTYLPQGPGPTSMFYKQVLDIWFSTNLQNPIQGNHILKEKLWKNSFIMVDDRPIVTGYNTWERNGIIFVSDVINPETGRLLSHTDIERKYMMNVDIMKYNSLISAIPKEWIRKIVAMAKPLNMEHVRVESPLPELLYKGKLVPITHLYNKDFYSILLNAYFVPPTAIAKWCTLHTDLNNVDWRDIFSLPYILVRSTILQTFQYKILNRIIACKHNLFKWKIKESDLCVECALPDTIEHYFYECNISIMFWRNLERWINTVLDVHIQLTICDVLLGIPNPGGDQVLFLINYCILNGKWYIYRQKLHEKIVFFPVFLSELKYNLEVEKYTMTKECQLDTFLDKWNMLYEAI